MQVKENSGILFLFTIIMFFNKIILNAITVYDIINVMNKFLCTLLFFSVVTGVRAETNPFFNGYENQVAFNFGYGVNSGFLLPPPSQFVPFIMLQAQYSQPTTFFKLPARQSLNIFQTLGSGEKYGWQWDKFTIPIAMLSEDVALFYGRNWYTFMGLGVGMQAQQNKRIGSKLIFGFKLGAAYRLSECTSVELFMQHMSNGNTAPENNSYAFYGLGMTFNF